MIVILQLASHPSSKHFGCALTSPGLRNSRDLISTWFFVRPQLGQKVILVWVEPQWLKEHYSLYNTIKVKLFLKCYWNSLQEAWEECEGAAQVPYEPMCNQFISHMMEPLRAVVYEPRAHDLLEGLNFCLSFSLGLLVGSKSNKESDCRT